MLTALPEPVIYLVEASGLGNDATNSTDFVPGSFGLRLTICVVGVSVLAALWAVILRKRHNSHQDATSDTSELAVV